MIRHRARWISLLAIAVVIFVGARMGSERDKRGMPSSFDTTLWGWKALRLFAEARNLKVVSWKRSLSELNPNVRVLFLGEPPMEIRRQEMGALKSWVRGGGTLVRAGGDYSPGEEEWKVPFTKHRAAEGMLSESELAFRVKRDPKELEKATLEVPASYPAPGLPLGAALRVRPQYLYDLIPKGMVAYAGKAYLSKSLGKGKVLLLSDPLVLSNGGLRLKSNAVFAVRLLSDLAKEAGEGSIAFDEYHHGYREMQQFAVFAQTPAAKSFFLQALLVALLAVWGLGRRFGVPIFHPIPPARRSMEFIDSLARLYRRRGLRRECTQVVSEDLRRRLCGLSGRAMSASWRELAGGLERWFGRNDLLPILERGLRGAGKEEVPKRTFLRFHRILFELRSKLWK